MEGVPMSAAEAKSAIPTTITNNLISKVMKATIEELNATLKEVRKRVREEITPLIKTPGTYKETLFISEIGLYRLNGLRGNCHVNLGFSISDKAFILHGTCDDGFEIREEIEYGNTFRMPEEFYYKAICSIVKLWSSPSSDWNIGTCVKDRLRQREALFSEDRAKILKFINKK